MNISDDTIVRIIDTRTGKPLKDNRGRPMTYLGFKNNIEKYKKDWAYYSSLGVPDVPSGKYSNPEFWALQIYGYVCTVPLKGEKK